MQTVTLEEAKERLEELVERTAAGEEIVITHHALPGVRLTPTETPNGSKPRHDHLFGLWKGKIELPYGWDDPLKDFAPYME